MKSHNERTPDKSVTHGTIDEHFPDGYVFHWTRSAKGEISGYVSLPGGLAVLPGSSGWYRTDCPGYAADRARYLASEHARESTPCDRPA